VVLAAAVLVVQIAVSLILVVVAVVLWTEQLAVTVVLV
jgi:hypothetical protein